jgi:peptidoglycan/xylan/chitin deacetylase (PgdA/CDA1 family)
VVSLTFDDGWANQYDTVSTLAAHGMKGTYYVNTGQAGTSGFMSWDQLVALDAAGHEVTGHTLDHVDLVAVGATEARRQICDDRQNLVSRGFIAKSFAYPFGAYDTTTESIVRDCGYASGRGAFGLRNIGVSPGFAGEVTA